MRLIVQRQELEVKPPAAAGAHELALDATPVVRIQPSRGGLTLALHELWDYRELLYFLIWRDINVRYKQTVLGAAWAIIQPLLAMAVFTLFFGRLAKMPSDGIPYPVFSYAALVPWTFFANGLNQAAHSTIRDANLIRKVYFPRLAIPLAAVLGGVLDFGLAFVVLLIMMVGYGIFPTANVLWLPLFGLLSLATALGVGLWLSALHVQFRDIRLVAPFVIQIWLFATPVVYSSSLLPRSWRFLYGLNPMVGVIEGFRWALLRTPTHLAAMVAASSVTAIALLVSGAFYYLFTERAFADII